MNIVAEVMSIIRYTASRLRDSMSVIIKCNDQNRHLFTCRAMPVSEQVKSGGRPLFPDDVRYCPNDIKKSSRVGISPEPCEILKRRR